MYVLCSIFLDKKEITSSRPRGQQQRRNRSQRVRQVSFFEIKESYYRRTLPAFITLPNIAASRCLIGHQDIIPVVNVELGVFLDGLAFLARLFYLVKRRLFEPKLEHHERVGKVIPSARGIFMFMRQTKQNQLELEN